jgi:hypothetical protein
LKKRELKASLDNLKKHDIVPIMEMLDKGEDHVDTFILHSEIVTDYQCRYFKPLILGCEWRE